jgi:hypothetical protein
MPPVRRSVTAWGSAGHLSPRDSQVVELVGRFREAGAGQIRAVLFPDIASKTPLDRALKRLTDAGYLARLGRMVGGFGGGSGEYVYQLGRAGWRYLGKPGGYRPLRVIDHHALQICECFVLLKVWERSGGITVISYTADPASRRTVGDILLTPDAHVELGVPATRRKFMFWLEIDRDTENAEVIRGKCARYWHAFQAWPDAVFPYVVFVVPDKARRRELLRIIAGGPAPARELFRVCELDGFPELIHSILQSA